MVRLLQNQFYLTASERLFCQVHVQQFPENWLGILAELSKAKDPMPSGGEAVCNLRLGFCEASVASSQKIGQNPRLF